jgi:hypothetical protein
MPARNGMIGAVKLKTATNMINLPVVWGYLQLAGYLTWRFTLIAIAASTYR